LTPSTETSATTVSLHPRAQAQAQAQVRPDRASPSRMLGPSQCRPKCSAQCSAKSSPECRSRRAQLPPRPATVFWIVDHPGLHSALLLP
jgi:hypothetical protein